MIASVSPDFTFTLAGRGPTFAGSGLRFSSFFASFTSAGLASAGFSSALAAISFDSAGSLGACVASDGFGSETFASSGLLSTGLASACFASTCFVSGCFASGCFVSAAFVSAGFVSAAFVTTGLIANGLVSVALAAGLVAGADDGAVAGVTALVAGGAGDRSPILVGVALLPTLVGADFGCTGVVTAGFGGVATGTAAVAGFLRRRHRLRRRGRHRNGRPAAGLRRRRRPGRGRLARRNRRLVDLAVVAEAARREPQPDPVLRLAARNQVAVVEPESVAA